MRCSSSKTRCACIVLAFWLVIVLGAVSAPNSASHGVVLSVAAQAPPAISNTTVRNNVSVLSESVTLGSSLHVEGVASTPQGPLAFVPVALHMGDIVVARTQTNESGAYGFSVPVGLNYVPAVFSGSASVYTVVESGNPAFAATPSAVVNLPVNSIPAYVIVAVVAGAAVLGVSTRARARSSRRVNVKGRLAAAGKWFPSATRAAQHRPERAEVFSRPVPVLELGLPLAVGPNAAESTEDLPPQEPVEQQPRADDSTLAGAKRTETFPRPAPVLETELALETARDLFDEGKEQPAVAVLFAATVTSLAKAHGLTLDPSMTHREKCATLQTAAPDVRRPLRTLTAAYERTTYARRSLTDEQRKATIEACKSLCKRLRRAGSP